MIQRLFATWLVCGAILFGILREPTPVMAEPIGPSVTAVTAAATLPVVATASACGSIAQATLPGRDTPVWQAKAGGDFLVGPYRAGLHPDQPCGGRRLAAAR